MIILIPFYFYHKTLSPKKNSPGPYLTIYKHQNDQRPFFVLSINAITYVRAHAKY